MIGPTRIVSLSRTSFFQIAPRRETKSPGRDGVRRMLRPGWEGRKRGSGGNT